jgi:hypothetical protein
MSKRGNSLVLLLLWALAKADTELIQVTATFQKRAENGQGDSPRYAKGAWVKVAGFADSRYFYGQLQLLEKHKVAGYLYATAPLPKRESPPWLSEPPTPKQDPIRQEQIYVYGEVIRPGEFRVFDQQGTLYRLLAVKTPR